MAKGREGERPGQGTSRDSRTNLDLFYYSTLNNKIDGARRGRSRASKCKVHTPPKKQPTHKTKIPYHVVPSTQFTTLVTTRLGPASTIIDFIRSKKLVSSSGSICLRGIHVAAATAAEESPIMGVAYAACAMCLGVLPVCMHAGRTFETDSWKRVPATIIIAALSLSRLLLPQLHTCVQQYHYTYHLKLSIITAIIYNIGMSMTPKTPIFAEGKKPCNYY